jgi:hypothetical protein
MAIALLTLQMAGCATQGESKSPNVEVGAPVASATPAPRLPTEPAGAATHAVKPVQVLPPPNETELKYGIQIAQLGLTAAGGLVDVRFKVLDPAKVKSLLSNPANAPMLYAGDKPPLTPPHHALQGARFSQGQVFYILYPNLRGAVQPGVEVTVAMGDVRLGPVKAQ